MRFLSFSDNFFYFIYLFVYLVLLLFFFPEKFNVIFQNSVDNFEMEHKTGLVLAGGAVLP